MRGTPTFGQCQLADIAEIGQGFYTDNTDGIRRYDEDPKVYPRIWSGKCMQMEKSFVVYGKTPICCWAEIGI